MASTHCKFRGSCSCRGLFCPTRLHLSVLAFVYFISFLLHSHCASLPSNFSLFPPTLSFPSNPLQLSFILFHLRLSLVIVLDCR
ncbi:hypothetical protein BJX61DRAFT_527178, partial [Aspergillus egyptiacus]